MEKRDKNIEGPDILSPAFPAVTGIRRALWEVPEGAGRMIRDLSPACRFPWEIAAVDKAESGGV